MNIENSFQNILKLLRMEGSHTVGMISWEFGVSAKLVDVLMAHLEKEGRVKTEDGIFWELGPNPRVFDGYCVERKIDPLFIVLCGPSHSGKSNFAEKLRPFFKVVNSDEIREKLTGSSAVSKDESKIWKKFGSMKRKFLKDGYNVVLDACHIYRKARWHSVQDVTSRYVKTCIVFDLPFSSIRKRWLKEKRIPYSEVRRLWTRFQKEKPNDKELIDLGFDKIVFFNGVKGVRISTQKEKPPFEELMLLESDEERVIKEVEECKQSS